MLKGNKGEWSEVYALLKLVSDGEMYVGDENILKVSGLLYPIVKILRDQANSTVEYSIEDEIVIVNEDAEEISIPIKIFREQTTALLEIIQSQSKGVFEIAEMQEFLDEIKCTTLKAKSSKKTDIRIVIYDKRTNVEQELGFSIKSQLGNPSTLLNSGKTTNFVFSVSSCKPSDSHIDSINSINTRSKIKDRIKSIVNNDCILKFRKMENPVFEGNLILIDSKLPEIISHMVYDFYMSNISSVRDLVERLAERNPLGFNMDNHHLFYEYKIKRFLTEVALGMMPASVWDGVYDATGGYLVVKKTGELLSYHIYNKNNFEDYLFHNTKFETGSSTRNNFGKLYREDDSLFFNLNLQIRFIK